MVMKLYDTDIILEKEYPERFSAEDGGITESGLQLALPLGKGFYKEIYFEGVHIGYGSALLAKSVLLNFESDFETVEMHFALKGSSSAKAAGFREAVRFGGRQHNILYGNRLSGEMHWNSTDFQLFEINLSPGFFKKYLPEDSALFHRFRESMEAGCSDLLNPAHHLISLQMYRIIDEIMRCNRKGLFKRMFLEARVIELLLLQFEQFQPAFRQNSGLKKADVEKIHAVREYILCHLNEARSLADLAHTVGTNEFTLKRGFREIFGTTVFGFWSDARMEEARRMLSEQEMNVNEVSDFIGYKNPRHFSTAFKRKFGVLPGAVKREFFSSHR